MYSVQGEGGIRPDLRGKLELILAKEKVNVLCIHCRLQTADTTAGFINIIHHYPGRKAPKGVLGLKLVLGPDCSCSNGIFICKFLSTFTFIRPIYPVHWWWSGSIIWILFIIGFFLSPLIWFHSPTWNVENIFYLSIFTIFQLKNLNIAKRGSVKEINNKSPATAQHMAHGICARLKPF